ncbi:MAG: hypothetical protein GY820_09915 [Gammaproteobacteria bacterium]|nr:hypothetical protein [Gammaproteobacteria bacterium]
MKHAAASISMVLFKYSIDAASVREGKGNVLKQRHVDTEIFELLKHKMFLPLLGFETNVIRGIQSELLEFVHVSACSCLVYRHMNRTCRCFIKDGFNEILHLPLRNVSFAVSSNFASKSCATGHFKKFKFVEKLRILDVDVVSYRLVFLHLVCNGVSTGYNIAFAYRHVIEFGLGPALLGVLAAAWFINL